MNKVIDNYRYTECGLKNIYVAGLYLEDDRGDSYIKIPAIKLLHAIISECLLKEERQLTGEEFYFLRVELGMSIDSIAKQLNVDNLTLQNWQDTGQVEGSLDFKFRQLFLEKQVTEQISIPIEYSKKVTSDISIKYHTERKQYSLISNAA